MSRLFNGSTDYLESNPTTAVVTDYPFTVSAWVKMTAIGATGTIFALSDKDTTNPNGVYQARLGVISNGLAFLSAGDGVGSTTTSVGTLSAGTWYSVIGVWTSATDRTIYADGSSANGTTSRVLSGLDDTTLGRTRYNDTSFSQPLNGRIAQVAVWNTALGSTDRAMLQNAANPLTVAYSSLVAYWPLTANVSPETSLVGTCNMTVNGATYSSDDPVVSRINPGPTRARVQAVSRAATV